FRAVFRASWPCFSCALLSRLSYGEASRLHGRLLRRSCAGTHEIDDLGRLAPFWSLDWFAFLFLFHQFLYRLLVIFLKFLRVKVTGTRCPQWRLDVFPSFAQNSAKAWALWVRR